LKHYSPGKKAERATGVYKRGLESPPVPVRKKRPIGPGAALRKQKKATAHPFPHRASNIFLFSFLFGSVFHHGA
jgi:hypothetical protein